LRAAADAARRSDDRGVDDGVDLGRLQDFDDQRVADVGANELRASQLDGGFLEIDADYRGDVRVLLQALSQPSSEETRDPGDQDSLASQNENLPKRLRSSRSVRIVEPGRPLKR